MILARKKADHLSRFGILAQRDPHSRDCGRVGELSGGLDLFCKRLIARIIENNACASQNLFSFQRTKLSHGNPRYVANIRRLEEDAITARISAARLVLVAARPCQLGNSVRNPGAPAAR
jgi:hypothetical protein